LAGAKKPENHCLKGNPRRQVSKKLKEKGCNFEKKNFRGKKTGLGTSKQKKKKRKKEKRGGDQKVKGGLRKHWGLLKQPRTL